MDKMYLFDLGILPYQQSMLVFHALARMNIEGLVIVSPKDPFLSVGYFQDLEKEVDLDYCRKEGLPIFRREVGGGTVYLDQDQIFYHTIWNKDNPNFPNRLSDIYEYLSLPPIDTYAEFGIQTKFREVNDIVTAQGKKIAGLGGADIDDSMVFVGSMMMDFDYERMSKSVKIPDEKWRDKVYKTIEENVTTMKREMDRVPPRQEIIDDLVKRYENQLGKFTRVKLNDDILAKMTELAVWFNSPEFMYKRAPRIPKGLKIREGVEIIYEMYKAQGGLIRSAQEVKENTLEDIGLSGDFTLLPKRELDGLESTLKGTEREKSDITDTVDEFYENTGVETPGVKSRDITKAIIGTEKDD